MNIRSLLDKRNAIYGLCAIWIIEFHVCLKMGYPIYIPVITDIVSMGNMGVDIFLFFSGLCLALAAVKNKYEKTGWGGYFRKRFVRVVIPYVLIGIPYYLWNAFVENGSHGFASSILLFGWNYSSASFWLRGRQTTWFVFAIIVFYVLFPILYGFIRRNRKKLWKIIVLLLCVLLFGRITASVPVLKNSAIAWARLPIFVIGIITGCYFDQLCQLRLSDEKKKALVILAIVLVIVFGIFISLKKRKIISFNNAYCWLMYAPMTIALLYCIIVRGEKWTHSKYGVLNNLGSMSLELYLVHITLLHPLKYYGVMDTVGFWMYLLLPVVTIPISYFMLKIEQLILAKAPVKI